MGAENFEVLPAASVAVAVTHMPAAEPGTVTSMNWPLPSVVSDTDPRYVFPWPAALVSLAKKSKT